MEERLLLKEAKEDLRFSSYLATRFARESGFWYWKTMQTGIRTQRTIASPDPIWTVAWSSKWLVILCLNFLGSLLRLHVDLAGPFLYNIGVVFSPNAWVREPCPGRSKH